MKTLTSPTYNYVFNEKTGFFARWGKTFDDDPTHSPIGMEIADIEITTSCSGPNGKVCAFCYKSNTPNGTNMSFDTFKTIFDKLPKSLTQIAFGADATLTANPDVWKIMDYCRTNDINPVVPNVTVANITTRTARKLANVCGAVAVSRYENKHYCYDSVKRLTDVGMTQTNIHQLICEETYDQAIQTIMDTSSDKRLSGLNAIVFLSLKQTGRGTGFTRLSQDKFQKLIAIAMAADINFGFDSCSANKFLNVVESHPKFKQFLTMSEPCESTCFSIYINVDGFFFPCSFAEHHGDWKTGIDMKTLDNFDSLWNHSRTTKFRTTLINNTDKHNVRACPLYDI